MLEIKHDGTLTHPALEGISVYLFECTPGLAGELLDWNSVKQRTLSAPAVERYSEDMQLGAWPFAGDPIRRNTNGDVIDGQHRLTAIRESGETQIMLMVDGLDQSVMAAIDTGRRRSLADLVKMERTPAIKYHKEVAGLCARIWFWDNGNYGCRGLSRVPNSSNVNATPSHAVLLAHRAKVEAELELTFEQAAQVGMKCTMNYPGISASSYATLWVLMSRFDKDLREAFFHEYLVEPKSAAVDYPVSHLKWRLGKRSRNERYESWLQLHWLITTANAWHAEQPLSSLRTPPVAKWNTLATLQLTPKLPLEA